MEAVVWGLVIAYIMSPVMNFIEDKILEKIFKALGAGRDENGQFKQWRLIRNLSILFSMTIFIILLVSFFAYILPQLLQSISDIIKNINVYYRNADQAVNKFLESSDPQTRAAVNYVIDQVYIRINSFIQENIIPNMTHILQTVSKYAFNIIGGFFNIFIGIIVSFYVLHSKEQFCGQGKKLAYSFLREEQANEIIAGFRFVHETFTGFVTGKIVDSIIIGIVCYILNIIFKIPYPVLIAVIVGVTNIIPFFGPYIGEALGFLILVLIDPPTAVVFLIFVIILQQVDGNILGPKILGNSTGLSSFWVIFAIMFFGSIWGFIGWVLGVPIFAVLYAFVAYVTDRRLEAKDLTTDEDTFIETAYIEKGQFHYLGDPSSTKYRSEKQSSSWRRIFKSKHKNEAAKREKAPAIKTGTLSTDKHENVDHHIE
ncbi:AI-2E family transporter [Butyrivibrio sp. MC2013]|uniref:AI-2E family transporter n=1 Tax=Butyrivibrio sp. MC2013 TaxID=1280686 RepID=UPI001FA73063|nr:AI-2E family transporter [Butyrivibrio sp. MC2013]